MVAGCSANVIHPEAVIAGRGDAAPVRTSWKGWRQFFKVLGDSTRLRILHALLAGELCVCDLSETLSHERLRGEPPACRAENARGWCGNRRDGKVVYYSLSDDHVTLAPGVHADPPRGRIGTE